MADSMEQRINGVKVTRITPSKESLDALGKEMEESARISTSKEYQTGVRETQIDALQTLYLIKSDTEDENPNSTLNEAIRDYQDGLEDGFPTYEEWQDGAGF